MMHARRSDARDGRTLLRDALLGAIAAPAAGWLMGKATSFLYERESKPAREREDAARGDEAAYGVAADKLAGIAGRELSDEQRQKSGRAIHWALAIGAGAAYGALRRRMPVLGGLGGVVFGTLFFVLVDEIGNVALGLTPGPREFPWQAHARGLAGHLAFGVAEEAQLAAADRLLSRAHA